MYVNIYCSSRDCEQFKKISGNLMTWRYVAIGCLMRTEKSRISLDKHYWSHQSRWDFTGWWNEHTELWLMSNGCEVSCRGSCRFGCRSSSHAVLSLSTDVAIHWEDTQIPHIRAAGQNQRHLIIQSINKIPFNVLQLFKSTVKSIFFHAVH